MKSPADATHQSPEDDMDLQPGLIVMTGFSSGE
jgi:hypothetical protein